MKYISNPVTVEARRIIGCGLLVPEVGMELRLEDGSAFQATPGMIARYLPLVDDYVVTQEDGYVYVNPKAVFKRKYRLA